MATFSDFAKKGAPHESAMNGNQVKRPPPEKAIKKPSKLEAPEGAQTPYVTRVPFFAPFGSIVGAKVVPSGNHFWHRLRHFGDTLFYAFPAP